MFTDCTVSYTTSLYSVGRWESGGRFLNVRSPIGTRHIAPFETSLQSSPLSRWAMGRSASLEWFLHIAKDMPSSLGACQVTNGHGVWHDTLHIANGMPRAAKRAPAGACSLFGQFDRLEIFVDHRISVNILDNCKQLRRA